MKEFYEITKLQTVGVYERYSVNEKGEKNLLHSQTRVNERLWTADQLVAEAQKRCIPNENITAQIAPGLIHE